MICNNALLKNINTITGSEMSIYQLQKQFEIYFDILLVKVCYAKH